MKLKSVRKHLRNHPNSIMIFSYLLMMNLPSFLGTESYKYSYILLFILPIGLIFLNIWIRKKPSEIIQIMKNIKWLKLGIMLLIVFIIVTTISMIDFNTTSMHSANSIMLSKEMKHFWFMPVYVVLLAPILEELTFRSAAYTLFLRAGNAMTRSKNTVKIIACLFVGIAFAFFHQDNMMAIYMIFSWILQWITNRWGLKYAMGVHIGFNFIGFITTFLM